MPDAIVARGVRVHNLKGIDVEIPLRQMVVLTGVSGAGKSSLAFDTLYAEGQRRYVEGLSAHARHFLERLERPEADLIDGLCPAVAVRRRAGARGPRSTVATAAEVHELLSAVFTDLGEASCLACGGKAGRDDPESAAGRLLSEAEGAAAVFAFAPPRPLDAEERARLLARGYRRLLVGEAVVSAEAREADLPDLGSALVVADRVAVTADSRSRVAEAVEAAYREGAGVAWAQVGARRLRFAEVYSCRQCGAAVEEPRPRLFSWSDPSGACPECHGFGNVAELDLARVVPDASRSLAQGAVEPWSRARYRALRGRLRRFCQENAIPWRTPWARLTPEQRAAVIEGKDGFPGVAGFFRRLEKKKYRVHVRVLLSRYRRYRPCPACEGSRLRAEARAVRVAGRGVDEVSRSTVGQALEFARGLGPGAGSPAARLRHRLSVLDEVGLGHLELHRPLATLSSGEAQRLALAGAVAGGLAGALYVVEEPAAGLHARDVLRLAGVLRRLCEVGNTVLVIEHHPLLVRAADRVIDLGPGAGEQGGRVVFAGSPQELEQDGRSLTGKFLRGELRVRTRERRARAGARAFQAREVRGHNLHGVEARFPHGGLTCVTGVSGAGKSSLLRALHAALCSTPPRRGELSARVAGAEGVDRVILLDDAPVGRTPRSNAVTYLKALDPVREIFAGSSDAKRLSLTAADFSFNVAGGRCEDCAGAGVTVLDLHFMGEAVLPCEACQGRRFRPTVLEVRVRGQSIHDVLQMTVQEALHFFGGQPKVTDRLRPLAEVGLGYVRLGQPASTLSSGEAQRLRLAAALDRPSPRTLYLLDEPTIGLHPADVAEVLDALLRLLAAGATVVAATQDMDVVKQADWVIELGPGGGTAGGRVLFEGSPEGLAAGEWPTSPPLRAALAGAEAPALVPGLQS
jgi:excinuclease ABC subunit A